MEDSNTNQYQSDSDLPRLEVRSDFLSLARVKWKKKQRADNTEERHFRESFGIGVLVALNIWYMLIDSDFFPENGTVEHYFWALMFMKVYGKMQVMCTLAGGCDPKTFRKWSWIFIEAIASCEYLVVSAFMSQTVNCCFIN